MEHSSAHGITPHVSQHIIIFKCSNDTGGRVFIEQLVDLRCANSWLDFRGRSYTTTDESDGKGL